MHTTSSHYILSSPSFPRGGCRPSQGGGVSSIYIWTDGRQAPTLGRTGGQMGRQPGAMDDGSLDDVEASGGWLQDLERRAASGNNLVWDFGKGSALHLGELTARAHTAHNIQILQIDEQGNQAEERPADLGLREHVCGLTMMTALWGFLGTSW